MTSEIREQRPYGFVVGLMVGTIIGAALATWLTSDTASELRERVGQSARKLGTRASEEYRHTAARVGDAVGDLTRPFISS